MEQGNTAMHFDGTWQFEVYPYYPVTKWKQGNIDIVQTPRGPKGSVAGAEASGLNIPVGTNSKNVKWAWEYIKYMTTEPGQTMGINFGVDSVPNTKALARKLVPTFKLPHNSRIILELLPGATLPFWCEAISDADLENMLVIPPFSLAPELHDLYMGHKTAAEAMPSVNRRVQAILDRDQGLAKHFGARLHL
jgi:ABC-type glycerol-3-phosphate transport system substrate-binding protein